jgi:hypothetical protein
MKKKSFKGSVKYEVPEDTLEGEIIDLVDPADEYLETIETNLNLSALDGNDLDDTLDEELMGIDPKDSKAEPKSENVRNPNFEEALVKLFESSESAAAKLIEEEFQKEELGEESLAAEDHLSGGGGPRNKPGGQATNEKDGTEDILELKKEFSENLFLNLEVVKKTASREANDNPASSVGRESRVTSDKTKWINSDRYYPGYVHAIDRKIAEYKKEIERLVETKKKIKNIYEQLRSILYLEGEELKNTVALILKKYWSLKLSFMNTEKRAGFSDNILIKHNNRFIIAKIKGTQSVYPSHKFIAQVWQDLHYSGLGTKADGALIVNHDIENDPENRGLPYANEDAEQLDDLIIIDTRVLHKLTTAIIDDDLSLEEAKRILFRKGRAEF